ncbi:MAG TPA: restriction endonuclease subunit S, partial [Bacilli bacterium]|nr:restriction endonuclease subunit S [Bacilli bacterium]
IVRILDNFTELTAELTTELTARKKQYEFYRDELLVSDNSNKTIKLSDLFDIRNGYTPSKDNPEFWDNGTIPWFRLEDINDNGRILYDSYQHISDKALKRNGLFKDNSIIISTSATIGEYALIKVPFLCNQRFACLTIKDEYKNNFSIEFLYHYCPLLSQYCKNHLNKGNFASVDMTKFGDFLFPILDLNEQQRIVDILDKFDAYCNDLSIGLPAEIAARQKQYEYYRDKLLTFKELQA